MITYKNGSTGDGVKEVQTLLKNNGYELDVDGIYGPITEQAVRDYQTKNNLAINGIVGDETIGSLRSSITSASTDPGTIAPGTDAQGDLPNVKNDTSKESPNASFDNAQSEAQNKLTILEKGYKDPVDDTIDALYDKILNQKGFEYDPYADPTYNQYAEHYKKNASLMSENVLAQAAELTGGYGSSYGQAVASQAYNEQMSELNDIIPTLRQNAYQEWQDQRSRDIEALSMMLNERNYDRSVFESDRAFDEAQRLNDRDYDRSVFESDRAFDEAQRLNDRDYDRSVFESDRAFDESVRKYDQNFAEQQRQYNQNFAEGQRQYNQTFAEQQRQYNANLDLDRKSLELQQQKYNTDLNAQAMAAGFASWDEYVNAVKNGTYSPQSTEKYDNFSLSEVQNAAEVFKNKGAGGLDDYIAQLEQTGKNYSDEQFYSLIFNATGLDKVNTYEQAFSWIANNSTPMPDNLTAGVYYGLRNTYKGDAQSIIKSESEWRKNPEYSSYPEYLRYTLYDIISG